MIDYPEGMCSGSRDLFNFREINDNISETAQHRYVVITDCRKRYMAYRIVAILMTLSDFQGHAPNESKPFKMHLCNS